MDADANRELAGTLGEILRERDEMVAVAESSTGGLLGSTLTDVPGSSAYFERGVVSYSNESKVELLDVDPETIDEQGAVSQATAREMAVGVRALAGTEWGVSTTGIAGPGGGTSRNPVGTIYVGVASPTTASVRDVIVVHERFDGDRLANKTAFVSHALRSLQAQLE